MHIIIIYMFFYYYLYKYIIIFIFNLGTPIALSITIDRDQGTAIFDFQGTGLEVYGNLNAPPAVTASAIIYCLRCLLPESDIPLNQGRCRYIRFLSKLGF